MHAHHACIHPRILAAQHHSWHNARKAENDCMQPKPSTKELDAGRLPSLGAERHFSGRCTPCIFNRRFGCRNKVSDQLWYDATRMWNMHACYACMLCMHACYVYVSGSKKVKKTRFWRLRDQKNSILTSLAPKKWKKLDFHVSGTKKTRFWRLRDQKNSILTSLGPKKWKKLDFDVSGNEKARKTRLWRLGDQKNSI